MDVKKLQENLEKNGFGFSYFETKGEANDYLVKACTGKSVGIGGSKTIEALGFYEQMVDAGETIYWHWKQPADEARANAATAKIYLSSANAIAETGEIVNIDGTCNRVAEFQYDKEKVYFVVGVNKICPDMHSALHRARNIAAPLNARRLNCKTPCAEGELKCHDCNSPSRVCRSLSVLWKRSLGVKEMEVVLINEELGY